MCGPSAAMKNINNNIQDFASKVKSEAGDVFDASSDVFHKIMGSVEGILKGGPSQYGYSAGEDSSRRALAVQQTGAEARNLRAAAGASAAAIGGGNTVAPAGSTQAAVLSANQKAAEDNAMIQNQITSEGFAKGERSFDTALKATEERSQRIQRFDGCESGRYSGTDRGGDISAEHRYPEQLGDERHHEVGRSGRLSSGRRNDRRRCQGCSVACLRVRATA